MTASAVLPALPAARGARWLALRLLHEADEARARLADTGDAGAPRDLHRALRRLHALLRAFREPLRGAVRGKDRRRIRALARAAARGRAAGARLAWTERLLPELDGTERPGAELVLARLREEAAETDRALREDVERRFPRVHARLARRLAVYRSTVTLETPVEGPPLATAVAERVTASAAELRERLDAVGGVDDAPGLRRARAAARRLRDLLETVAPATEGAGEAAALLAGLRDALGEMRDAEALRDVLVAAGADLLEGGEGTDDDPRPGLRALAHHLYDRRAAAWTEVETGWTGDAAEGFFARVEQVGRAPGGGAGVEIERKYLLRRFPRLPDGAVEQRIEQGWLPGERLQERVRRVRTREGERFFRTVKVGRGVTRLELEEETTREVFRRLWPLTRGKRVSKRRYAVADGALVWEVDRFTDRPLVLAEVELPREDTPAPPPAWLADAIAREVTGEPEFVNLNLAR